MSDWNVIHENFHSARWTHAIHHSVTYYEHTVIILWANEAAEHLMEEEEEMPICQSSWTEDHFWVGSCGPGGSCRNRDKSSGLSLGQSLGVIHRLSQVQEPRTTWMLRLDILLNCHSSVSSGKIKYRSTYPLNSLSPLPPPHPYPSPLLPVPNKP